jgi:hypothetical protein
MRRVSGEWMTGVGVGVTAAVVAAGVGVGVTGAVSGWAHPAMSIARTIAITSVHPMYALPEVFMWQINADVVI